MSSPTPLPPTLRDPAEAPFAALEIAMQPGWVDHNGHLNMGYYLVAFDLATDAFLPHCGLGHHGREHYGITTMTLEGHITYEREMMAGAGLRFTTQLLGFDAKRLHYMHFLHHARDGYLASTNELISIAVDMRTRRSAAMPEVVLARLEKIQEAHRRLPRPAQQGRVIGIRSGKPA
ncbi:MAG: thioesterase family protein [Reyranellaceae bacterium]